MKKQRAGCHKNIDRSAVANGRPCLLKDIDPDYVAPGQNKSNRQLMAEGNSPFDKAMGMRIELHHMRQEHNAPFVELIEVEHNSAVLHKHNDDSSWRNNADLAKLYDKLRRQHYKRR